LFCSKLRPHGNREILGGSMESKIENKSENRIFYDSLLPPKSAFLYGHMFKPTKIDDHETLMEHRFIPIEVPKKKWLE